MVISILLPQEFRQQRTAKRMPNSTYDIIDHFHRNEPLFIGILQTHRNNKRVLRINLLGRDEIAQCRTTFIRVKRIVNAHDWRRITKAMKQGVDLAIFDKPLHRLTSILWYLRASVDGKHKVPVSVKNQHRSFAGFWRFLGETPIW